MLLKGTKVEGVYNADPVLVKDAVKYDEITYMDILRQGLKVMDLTAVSLCKDNNLPMIIFNMNQPGNIRRVVLGEKVGRWLRRKSREKRDAGRNQFSRRQ